MKSKDTEEAIKVDQYFKHFLSDQEEFMTSSISAVTVLKAVHSDSFSSKSLKVKMFIIQINNKITDAAETTENQKIRYIMSLLCSPALKWAATFINNEGKTTFDTYSQFKQRFLRRFTDSNSIESAIEKLMNLH